MQHILLHNFHLIYSTIKVTTAALKGGSTTHYLNLMYTTELSSIDYELDCLFDFYHLVCLMILCFCTSSYVHV